MTPNYDEITQRESTIKALEELKCRIEQIRGDGKIQDRLSVRISELEEAKGNLTGISNSLKTELEDLSKKNREQQNELQSCRDELSTKIGELNAFRALPREDPSLQKQIDQLQSDKRKLQAEQVSASQEIERAKEKHSFLCQTTSQLTNRIKELEETLDTAQSSLQSFTNEKHKYTETAKSDIESAIKEVASAAATARSEQSSRYEGRIKSLEQRRSEVEAELKSVKEELLKSHEEGLSHASNVNRLEAEIFGHKEQIAQHATHIQQLESQIPNPEELKRSQKDQLTHINNISKIEAELFIYKEQIAQHIVLINQLKTQKPAQEECNLKEQDMQAAMNELSELRASIEVFRSEAEQSLGVARCNQGEIENHLRQVDLLQAEKEYLEVQNLALQKKYDTLSITIAQQFAVKQLLVPSLTSSHGASLPASGNEWQPNPSNVDPYQQESEPVHNSPNEFAGSNSREDRGYKSMHPTPEAALRTALSKKSISAPASVGCTQTPNKNMGSSDVHSPITPANVIVPQSGGPQLQSSQETSKPSSLRPANRRPSGLSQQYNLSTQDPEFAEVKTTDSSRTSSQGDNPQKGVFKSSAAVNSPHEMDEVSSRNEFPDENDYFTTVDQSRKRMPNTARFAKDTVIYSPPDYDEVDQLSYSPKSVPFAEEVTAAKSVSKGFKRQSETAVRPQKTPLKPAAPKPLKGVLKNIRSSTMVFANIQVQTGKDSLQVPNEPPLLEALRNMAPGNGTNKKMTRSMAKGAYNRVVMGRPLNHPATDLPTTNDGSGVSKREQQHRLQTPGSQASSRSGAHISPMMPAPLRNVKKRKAIEVPESDRDAVPYAKARKVSLTPRKNPKLSVIPDSQESQHTSLRDIT
jgi:hypothetical protein